jgi:hypothetical protein
LDFRIKKFVLLALIVAANLSFGIVSRNILENGSFEQPAIPSGVNFIENPILPGWTIQNAYSVLYKSDGMAPVEGVNEFYFYNGDLKQAPITIIGGCTYSLQFSASANENVNAPVNSYAVLEAVDISNQTYELARINFSDFITCQYQWFQSSITFTCPETSFYTSCILQVRFHSGGMIHLDNITLNASSDEIVLDNYEIYANVLQLKSKWKDSNITGISGSSISLQNNFENRYKGRQALEFTYDNSVTGKGFYSEIELDILNSPFTTNWDSLDLKKLCISFCGNRINDVNETAYLILKDVAGNSFESRYPYSMLHFSDEKWHNWIIDISVFQNGGVNIANVSKLYIGFDDSSLVNRGASPGGKGVVYFDDIKLTNNCKSEQNLTGDFTSDGKVNFEDIVLLGNWWLSEY